MPPSTIARSASAVATPTPTSSVTTATTTLTTISNSADTAMEKTERPKPFRLYDLPTELRLQIYSLLLTHPVPIDLDPANHRQLPRFLPLFLVSRRTHAEAAEVFYSTNTFRIFPTHGRFFHTKRPLLARLAPRDRRHITRLDLRLGPGWTQPPRGWRVDDRLGLADMPRCRRLHVFLECDPASHPVFEGFRRGEDFYTVCCRDWLLDVLARVGSLREVVFDGWPGVPRDAPLLVELEGVAKAKGLRVLWGPERGWGKEMAGLEKALEGLALRGSGG